MKPETYLRQKKTAALEKLYSQAFEKRNQLEVWKGAGTILPSIDHRNRPMGNKGGVVDVHGEFVPLSAINYECAAYPVGKCEDSDKRAVYCGYFPMHWGHFLTEVICRLWYALEHDDEVDEYVFTVRPGFEQRMHPNMKAFFRALGILDKVVLTSQPKTYREIVVPEMCFRQGEYYSEGFMGMYDKVAENLLKEVDSSDLVPAEKIYLSRSSFKKNGAKIEINTQLLDHFFQKNGYKIVHPETLSLAELTWLLHHAKECVAPSGTICHNILFAPKTISWVIMEREAWLNPYQVNINQMRDCAVTYVDANYGLYPVEMGFGPYLMAYTSYFDQFAASRGYQKPDEEFMSDGYVKKGFAEYMKTYKEQSGYQWLMRGMESCADYLYESYEESAELFGPYLRREAPFLPQHYLSPHYWRKILGRLRRKL